MPGYDIDFATGDLKTDTNGHPVVTSAPSPELYLAIGIAVGTYIGDPELGSRIPAIVASEPAAPATEIEAAAADALARLEDAGLVAVQTIAFANGELTITTDGLQFDIPIG